MKQVIALTLSLLFLNGYGQFKSDNVKYKTVFPEDLCSELSTHPNFVFLDVRSDAEFNDTMSMAPSANIGHIKGAAHIDIRQLPTRWKELLIYKDRPLFIYCSHSQRSRRASRLLSDSGFTKIINVNGGLTNFYSQGIANNNCNQYSIVSALPYNIISAGQMAQNIRKYYIIDIRNDSAYTGNTSNESIKMQGRLADAVHIPFKQLANANIALSNSILLVDESGEESPLAAKMLSDKGFKNVSILFNGMEEWERYAVNTKQYGSVKWVEYSNYKYISDDELNDWMKMNKKFTIIDIRPVSQFSNHSKNYWQNLGQLKNAINIPVDSLNSNKAMSFSKTDPVVLYGFINEDDIFKMANRIRGEGYKNIYILYGGIWYMRWAAHNVKNKMYLADWVVNVPMENE